MDAQTRLILFSDRMSSTAMRPELSEALDRAGIDCRSSERLLATLPFAGNDNTAGSETELQANLLPKGSFVHD